MNDPAPAPRGRPRDWVFPILIGAALVALFAVRGGGSDRIPVGARIPAAPVLDARTGEETDLRAIAAEGPVALHVFATWCGACMREWGGLDALAARAGGDLRVALVGIDEPARIRALLESRPTGLPVYVGGREVERALRVEVYPSTVFVSRDLRALYDQGGVLSARSFRTAEARLADLPP